MSKSQRHQDRRLRLEWIEAGSLNENPLNWRRHSPEQLQSIRDLLSGPGRRLGRRVPVQRADRAADRRPRPQVGGRSEDAGARAGGRLERGGREEDPGHARSGRRDGDGRPGRLPRWSSQVTAEGLWVRDLLHNTQAALDAAGDRGGAGRRRRRRRPPCRRWSASRSSTTTTSCWCSATSRTSSRRASGWRSRRSQIDYPGGRTKIGLGRVIDGAKASCELLEGRHEISDGDPQSSDVTIEDVRLGPRAERAIDSRRRCHCHARPSAHKLHFAEPVPAVRCESAAVR